MLQSHSYQDFSVVGCPPARSHHDFLTNLAILNSMYHIGTISGGINYKYSFIYKIMANCHKPLFYSQ